MTLLVLIKVQYEGLVSASASTIFI